MEKFKIMILIVAVLGVMVSTVLITSNAEATSGSWEVTCNYDADGILTDVSCKSGGDANCLCRGSIPIIG